MNKLKIGLTLLVIIIASILTIFITDSSKVFSILNLILYVSGVVSFIGLLHGLIKGIITSEHENWEPNRTDLIFALCTVLGLIIPALSA
ncbi:hypothetical protein QX249_10940 [Vibrio parahaemolyticus]|uniref:Uncharacterized protein n=1 Tax=Vibrio parahaemolyticus TaxID=670 RepID=A0AAW8PY94_VIBPH|nr:hypothetical protein [Vibrio parahaemolyticus]MDS1821178.1 hypothetical protein [Vibrio parahaemolyticus]